VVGYALLDWTAPGRFEYVECGCLKVDGRRALNWRLGELTGTLEEIISELAPHELAIESAFHGKNAASSLKLAEARGAFKVLAIRHGLSVFEYAPARIKRAVVGKGRATKVEVQRRVSVVCGLSRQPESDAADALAVALCHAHAAR
jgi:crossover junction endodeoxyribonuclease RuvC